jgi:hypothetical protein
MKIINQLAWRENNQMASRGIIENKQLKWPISASKANQLMCQYQWRINDGIK